MFPTSQQLSELLVEDKERRIVLCEDSFALFCLFYFREFFTFKIPRFHAQFYEDAERLALGQLNEVCWIAFRESAKTSIAKMFVLWCICYAKKHYINFDSYDKAISESALFDIVTWMQSNKNIRRDFGDLYYEERKSDEEKKLKRISSFITTNKVKVEAFSTQQPTRGRIYTNFRPDLYILDDLENSETTKSAKITQGIIGHIDELKGGLATTGSVMYLGNYLTDGGVMRYVRDSVSRNPQGVVRDVPVVYKDGEIAWKDKYVETDEEAGNVNRFIVDRALHKVSLESKRRTLSDDVYEREMMNNPTATGDNIFDRTRIDELKKNCTKPKYNKAEFFVWDDFNPSHRYAIGADTSEGVGQDANASVLIDFSKLPNEQIGSYVNNRMAPDTFAYELKRQGDMFGTCLVAPEINNTGFATITSLKTAYPVNMIYRREEKDRITNILSKKLGWRSTEGTKNASIFELKAAVESGALLIRDERIMNELREYTQNNLRDVVGLSTRHFDLLMATAIAWAMRTVAQVSTTHQKEYVQAPYEPISAFEVSANNKSQDMFNMFE